MKFARVWANPPNEPARKTHQANPLGEFCQANLFTLPRFEPNRYPVHFSSVIHYKDRHQKADILGHMRNLLYIWYFLTLTMTSVLKLIRIFLLTLCLKPK